MVIPHDTKYKDRVGGAPYLEKNFFESTLLGYYPLLDSLIYSYLLQEYWKKV